jgi:hypothetical protein
MALFCFSNSRRPVRFRPFGSSPDPRFLFEEADVFAEFSGSEGFPYRLLIQEGETVIRSIATGTIIARFQAVLGLVTTHPSGRIWAGVEEGHVHLISLEGIR